MTMPTPSAQAAVNQLYDGDRASQALGIEILSVEPGRVRVAMAIRPDMSNGHGICHGGVLFTLADSAFAFACNSRGDPMVAAGASIEYLIPARVGERVIAAAAEVSRSERHGIYDVAITTASGETIAQFRGRCARLRTT
jgi:acyl-CoA thioesterase